MKGPPLAAHVVRVAMVAAALVVAVVAALRFLAVKFPAAPLPRIPKDAPAHPLDSAALAEFCRSRPVEVVGGSMRILLAPDPDARLPVPGRPPITAPTLGRFVRIARDERLAGFRDARDAGDGRIELVFEPPHPAAADALRELLTPPAIRTSDLRAEIRVRDPVGRVRAARERPGLPFAWALEAVRDVRLDGEVAVLDAQDYGPALDAFLREDGAALPAPVLLGFNCARRELASAAVRAQWAACAREGAPPPRGTHTPALAVRAGSREEPAARAIARRWGASLAALPADDFWRLLHARAFDAFVAPLPLAPEAPAWAGAFLHSSQARTGANVFGFTDAECDRRIEAGRMAQAYRRALEQAVFVPLDGPRFP